MKLVDTLFKVYFLYVLSGAVTIASGASIDTNLPQTPFVEAEILDEDASISYKQISSLELKARSFAVGALTAATSAASIVIGMTAAGAASIYLSGHSFNTISIDSRGINGIPGFPVIVGGTIGGLPISIILSSKAKKAVEKLFFNGPLKGKIDDDLNRLGSITMFSLGLLYAVCL